jgi:hypothetical protein
MKPGIGGGATNGRFGAEAELVDAALPILAAACSDQRLTELLADASSSIAGSVTGHQ